MEGYVVNVIIIIGRKDFIIFVKIEKLVFNSNILY